MARSFDTGSDDLTCEIGDDGVAVITMDRPERRNAFSDGMLAGLAASLDEVETANDVRCVVLTGAGGAFCAGGDVKGFAENDWAGGEGTPWDVGVHEQRLNHRATSGALFS
ncbi:MAG: enoyl-CoA hydratase, partial [Actinomycetia bacterium]|nr:enoyl-CoA hydratase [Actinomycetes bacterium]